jgi:hypothetical protein
VYLLVFHAYIKEMHGSRSKIPSKYLVRQRCAEGYNSGVKGLIAVTLSEDTYLLIYAMQHSPSLKANQFSASQEIPRIFWNQKFHCIIEKCPPPVPIWSQISLINATIQLPEDTS